MTNRFLAAAYGRRKAPKVYDPTFLDRELARIEQALPSTVPRPVQTIPSLQDSNQTVKAEVVQARSVTINPVAAPGTNLLEYTQQFDVGAWTKHSLNVTPDAIIAPDGTMTADTLATTAAGGYVLIGPWTVVSATKVTFSVHIRRLTTTAQTNFGIYDVTAGAQVVETACLWTGDNITGMANVGGAGATSYAFTSPATGWWRVSGLTNTTLDPTHIYTFFIYPRNSGNSGSIYAWGAQVNAGALTTYVQNGSVYTTLAVTGRTELADTNITGDLAVSGTATVGNLAVTTTPTFSALTASQAVFTNASKQLVSNAVTGSGSVVMSVSPTFTGTVLVAGFTYSQALGSLTPYATPAAFTQTLSTQFASTVSGATLMGYGTTSDATLKNRNGADVVSVLANTTDTKLAGKFGCNAATPQAAAASGGALAAYATGGFGLDSDAHMNALYTLVVNMRAALVSNGIMT